MATPQTIFRLSPLGEYGRLYFLDPLYLGDWFWTICCDWKWCMTLPSGMFICQCQPLQICLSLLPQLLATFSIVSLETQRPPSQPCVDRQCGLEINSCYFNKWDMSYLSAVYPTPSQLMQWSRSRTCTSGDQSRRNLDSTCFLSFIFTVKSVWQYEKM